LTQARRFSPIMKLVSAEPGIAQKNGHVAERLACVAGV
jgi:hypothetical protein